MSPGTIRVGIAGWDYPDWEGPVYAGGRFDRLSWIARFVDVIEINSTFYRPVAPRVAAGWARRTDGARPLRFTAKCHRSWTHERETTLDATVETTLAGLQPLRDAGRLGAVLVQFPQSFHDDERSREHLERIAESTRGWPIVVEVRHTSWTAAVEENWFAQRELGWCVIDQPQVGAATLDAKPRVSGKLAYLRLHGRNEQNWFRADAGRDARYDYLYTPPQLDRLADTARRMAQSAQELFVVQNNHFRGQGLVNTLQLMQRLHGTPPVAPGRLVDAYPDLADEVTVTRDELF